MADVEIFWGSGSQPSWKVLLAAEFKGVPWVSRLISFSAREHKSEAFLAMNPRGKVPVLRHGDVIVYESAAILAWLEATFPDRPVLGTSPAETAAIWQRMQEADLYAGPAFRKIYGPFFFGWSPDKADGVRAAVPEVRTELGRLEDVIGVRSHVVGDALTAADLCWYPQILGLLRALDRPEAAALDLGLLPLDEHFPAVRRMLDQVEALPGFERTIPPHWGGLPAR